MSSFFPSLHRSPAAEKPFQDNANIFGSPQKSPSREQMNKHSSPTKTPTTVNRYSSPSPAKTPPTLQRYSSPSFLSFAERIRNTPGDNIYGQGESLFERRESEEETASETTIEEPLPTLAATFPPYVERSHGYDDLTHLLTPQSLPQSREMVRDLFREIPLASTIRPKRSRLADAYHVQSRGASRSLFSTI